MPGQAYHVCDSARWISASGNAAFMFYNRSGSGKKVKISRLGIRNVTALNGNPASSAPCTLSLLRTGQVTNGKPVALAPYDSASAFPAGVTVRVGGSSAQTADVIRRLSWQKGTTNNGTFDFAKSTSSRNGYDGIGLRRSKDTDVENVTIRAGECVSLGAPVVTCGQLIKVSCDIIVNGTPNRTFAFSQICPLISPDMFLASFNNAAGSGVTIRLANMQMEEVGTYDTPYFQCVPVGGFDASFLSDTVARIPTQPMDSAYGPLDTSKVLVLSDVPILPFGVPAQYFSDGSPGVPKGVSYLQTKDFLGPAVRALFPEFSLLKNNGTVPDDVGCSFTPRGADLGFIKGDYFLREGEGLAIISSAETAINVATIGVSGWGIFELDAQISVQSAYVPDVTITGVVPGSDVVILASGTSNVLATGDAIAGTTYNYVTQNPASIDIGVLRNGYVPLYIRNFSLNQAGATIPVSQVADRNFV